MVQQVTRKLYKRICKVCIMSLMILPGIVKGEGGGNVELKGRIAYHSYSDYWSRDSKIYIVDFEAQTKECINDTIVGVQHTMNAHFNEEGTAIVFMGITERAYGDE